MLNREEILDTMEKKLSSLKSNKNTTKEEINSFESNENYNITTPSLLENEEFKKVHKVRNFNTYYYYISNLGRVLVVKDTKEELKNQIKNDTKLNWNNCKIIPIVNGYLTGNGVDDIPLATSTDVYNFTIEAGWLDNTEDKELAEEIVKQNIANNYYSNDRVELHHIDNDPSNNNLENLIWVPRSIHQTLHSKS